MLSSRVAEALGNFWSTSIQVLNLEGIGLGPSGFQKLKDVGMENLMLVEINIRFGYMLRVFFFFSWYTF